MIEQDSRFLVETWSLYALGAALLLVRFAVRFRTVGPKEFQGDDYFAMATLLFFTLDALIVHLVYYKGSNADFTEAELMAMSQSQLDQVVVGSKLELTAWYTYTALIWCLKGTMIFFFKRLTFGTFHQRLVTYIGIATALAYIPVLFIISLSCRPFHGNWQTIPLPDNVGACLAKRPNFMVTVILNVVTDAALLSIPLPLLWGLKIPMRQKMIIGLLLSSGVFVITAAIIRVVFSLSPNPSALTINRWGVRETLVGIISVNLPILRPLLRKGFWNGQGLSDSGAVGRGRPYALDDADSRSRAGYGQGTGTGTTRRSYPMGKMGGTRTGGDKEEDGNSSTEYIVDGASGVGLGRERGGEVFVETTVEVKSSNRADEDLEIGLTHTEQDVRDGSGDWKRGRNHVQIGSGL